MTAKTTGLSTHRDYDGSVEQLSGQPPADDQQVTSAEFNPVIDAVDDHAPRIDSVVSEVASIVDSSVGVTLATLKAETDALAQILTSDDPALDTAQERVDRIKQIISDADNLAIADIAGLQTSLDGLQSDVDGKEAIGVAQSLVTALEATIRGAGAAGVTLTTISDQITQIDAILLSDDATLDTAQERVDKIKQLLSDIDTLAIVDISGLQTTLDNLQAGIDGKEDIGVAASLFSQLNLDAIAVTKSKTPVAVFIYDTRKDSDDGAWRHRTQSTSWYQEELNTATRGSRREFPALAVIVIEGAKITIFDGDHSSLPMWMVFPASANGFINTTNTLTSIKAMDGKLLRTDNRGSSVGYGLGIADFVADSMRLYTDNSLTNRIATQPISSRSLIGFYNAGIPKTDYIVSSYINDVAITVLDDAPIDQATGLPKTTRAVATNGNGVYLVSLITHGGDVYDILASATGQAVSLDFDAAKLTVVVSDGSVHVWDDVSKITADGVASDRTVSNILGTAQIVESNSIASTDGLTLLHENPSTPTIGLWAHVTTTYNTGWKGGGNVLTALCSTDTSDLVGGTDDDRSANSNDLNVVGTINRTPVNTGCDLVAYSGFTASDYLEQPINSDLDFGTGDFSVVFWLKMDVSTATIVDRGNGTDRNWRIVLAAGQLQFDFRNGVRGNFLSTSAAGVTLSSGDRYFVVCVKKGDIYSIHLNGAETVSSTLPSGMTIETYADTTLRIGAANSTTGVGALTSGNICKFRVESQALSDDQIAKMYNDERKLFQENAQSTLFGTSDAVLAQDYDEVTDLLHVNTSDGRSVMDGLVRVDNTTTAASIVAAHDGMVVEG